MPKWVWDAVADKWEAGFRYLTEFANREGHCRVSSHYQTSDGYLLGSWVSHQRKGKDNLSPESKARLEALPGWVWDAFADKWETGFRYLTEFASRERNCLVPSNYRTVDGFRLGGWVSQQRTGKDSLSSGRKARLEALPKWVWDVLSDQWETGFRYLTEFANREGHCRVPQQHQTNDGFRLGVWVGNQRATMDWLPVARKEQLEALPKWVWNTLTDKWEAGFRYLTEFANRKGHCRVPRHYQTSDGYLLGSWVNNQRSTKDRLPTEQKEKLDAVPGWIWRIRER